MTQSGETERNIKVFKITNIILVSLKMLMPVFTVRISSLYEAIVSSKAEWLSSNTILSWKSYDLQTVWKTRHFITF